MYGLSAVRYANYSYADENPVQRYDDIESIGIRWHLEEFGIQRFEIVARLGSAVEVTNAYQHHLGHIIALYDHYIDQPITGQIYEIVPDGRYIQIICAGPAKRLYSDDYYCRDDIADITWPTAYTNALIRDIIEDVCPLVDPIFTSNNWKGTGVAIGGWRLGDMDRGGIYPGTAIKQLVAMGASDGTAVDFWLHDQYFKNGNRLKKPKPWLIKREEGIADWQFWRRDLVGSQTLSRHIWNLATNVKVGYGRLQGTHTGSGNSSTLVDSTATFIGNVCIGDRVLNITQTKATGLWIEFTVKTVTNDTTLTFEPVDHGGDWDLDDEYSLSLSVPKWTAYTDSSDYWLRTARPRYNTMDVTQANYYRDLYLDTYKAPVQQAAFTLGCPFIYDGYRRPWPLWRPLFGTSYRFRANDIIPEVGAWDAYNMTNTFIVVAMDYTWPDNLLRIVPATKDGRLDVWLARATNEQERLNQLVMLDRKVTRRWKPGPDMIPNVPVFNPMPNPYLM